MKDQVCLSTNQLIIFFFFNITIIIYLANKSVTATQQFKTQQDKQQDKQQEKQQEIQQEIQQIKQQEPLEIVNYPKYLNDPLRGPERRVINHINYNNVGFVTGEEGEKYLLFGRLKGYNSSQYEYYITDKDNSNIKYPVKYNNYKEIYDKDTVNIPQIGGNFTASIYDLPEIRYDPTLY